jgi:hypothetical protein
MRRSLRLVVLAVCTATFASPASALLLGPTPYTGFAGSPFDGVTFASWTLEDFEDSALPAGLLAGTSGIPLNFGSLRDSVENGQSGVSWYTSNVTSLSFSFDPGAPNGLPTHAGIVWTDVGFLLSDSGPATAMGDVVFEAFDQFGASLGTIGPVTLGDGLFAGEQGEDRFFGAIHGGGISKITISMPNSNDWEVDHLQFGVAALSPAPEPAGIAFAGIAAALAAARRHRTR